MKRFSSPVFGFACLVLLSSCDSDSPPDPQPFREDWQTIISMAPFPYNPDDPDNIGVTSITIGSLGTGGDRPIFDNRGDVIVEYTNPPGFITVEMRKFTFAIDQEEADGDFMRLQPYFTNGPMNADGTIDPAAACTADAWQDGCQVLVRYDGQIQPSRLGADLRVILPSNYRHSVNVRTEDNVAESAYQGRSDVCVYNSPGSVDVEMGSGKGYVVLAPETTPAPECTTAQIQACESYQIDMMDAAWSSQCGCTDFGAVEIASNPVQAVDSPQQSDVNTACRGIRRT